jgi:hypothetical protein
LTHVLNPDSEAGDFSDDGLYLYCLTGLHATNRVITCSLIHNRNLVFGEGTRLAYCDVIDAAGDIGMVIIMMGGLFFVLSYRLALTDAPSMQHEGRARSGARCASTRLHLSSGVGSEVAWDRLLVGS